MELGNIPFRLESSLMRTWYTAARRRPSSRPFVSGDSFRAVADHVLEPGRAVAPAAVKSGDVVFVESGKLTEFVRETLPQIAAPFVLVSHNGDRNIDESFRTLAENRNIVRWFAQNLLFRHPRLTAIPIGLENRYYHCNGVTRDFRRLRAKRRLKNGRVLASFTVGTNDTERRPALEALRSSRFVDIPERVNSRAYRRQLARYSFAASPPGNGVDCHRTWEALYLGVVPIVKRSPFYDFFPGLPVLAVSDWSEVSGWDAGFLGASWQSLSAMIDSTPYLQFDFWAGLIDRARRECSH